MPDGLVHWFDPVRGDAEVVRDGHAYHVPAGSIESAARHPGARVHFDVETHDGTAEATGVRLRQSARASRHRRHFGSLTSARRFDMKGAAPGDTSHPELHLAAAHPLQVARAWATNVARGDVDGACSLYAPDCLVHAGDRPLGRQALEGWVEALPVLGCERHATIHGLDGSAVVTWEPTGSDLPGLQVTCRIVHGRIAEQWAAEPVPGRGDVLVAMPPAGAPAGAPAVALFSAGGVEERVKVHARAIVDHAIATIEEPVLFARVKLSHEPDPARPRPARAQVLLDLNGEPLRVHATARSMDEALDLLERRLRDRLGHRAQRRLELHHADGTSSPGEWRHGDLEVPRPPYFDRPAEERQLVRHKTFAAGELTCDEAVFDMVQLDYDFYLFVDLDTGLDSIVERSKHGYRMTRMRPAAVALGPTAAPVELDTAEVPVLALAEAVERLGTSGERHLFFEDASSGRGAVLYVRYDGHYGLLTPE